ncbi:MAG: ABC transporter ATP-binding protein [Candidatus Omnitrophica bacterium]|nr:ABC transporter ATP-binding protein [Candidatus Omnitrophota bacterium]
MKILKIENVTLKLGERQVLNNLSLTVEGGTIHSILGPNAAGKSSLSYLIMGSSGYTPNTGKIYFLDKDITNLSISERARLGITLAWQEPARFEGLNVKDYISVGMKEKNDFLIKSVLHKVLLEPRDYLNRLVDKTLSGGERKRIELASVFAMRPKLAILDEPDSGIDILALDNIVEMIKELNQQGTTVLLITHREEVAEIANYTSLICSGFIVKEGTPQEVGRYFKEKCIPCPSKNFPDQKDEITKGEK